MKDGICRVELALPLFGQVRNWLKDDQIDFSAFIDTIRSHDLDAILGNSDCVIEEVRVDELGSFSSLKFWMKMRGTYVPFIIRSANIGTYIVASR